MFQDESERRAFLDRLHIKDCDFESARTSWDSLSKIYDDYVANNDALLTTAKDCTLVLQECPLVHSLNFRIKDKDHLIEKVIRKNREYYAEFLGSDSKTDNSKEKLIGVDNYRQQITDVIGIRLILLFKEDWESVHDYILEKYSERIKEKYAYYVLGDDIESYKRKGVEPKVREEYRSVHYVLQFPAGFAEIQVRTLAEEVWGEIDHSLRYPYNKSNLMLSRYMGLMAYISHYIDQMASFVKGHIEDFSDGRVYVSDNDVYNEILSEISKIDGNEEIVEKIKKIIYSSSNFQELGDMRDLMSSFYGMNLEGFDNNGRHQE